MGASPVAFCEGRWGAKENETVSLLWKKNQNGGNQVPTLWGIFRTRKYICALYFMPCHDGCECGGVAHLVDCFCWVKRVG